MVQPPDKVYQYLSIQPGSEHDMEITKEGPHHYDFKTTGTDPFVLLSSLTSNLSAGKNVLTFQYKSSSHTGPVQIFFAGPISEERSVRSDELVKSEIWNSYSVDLKEMIGKLSWGDHGDYLRFDAGNTQDVTIEIKNIYFRERTDDEIAFIKEQEAIREHNNNLEARIENYLSSDYEARITNVTVGADKISIQSQYSGTEELVLCELPPSYGIIGIDSFSYSYPLSSSFSAELPRYVNRKGVNYDRSLSRWILVKSGENKEEVVSHGRYADQLKAKYKLRKRN